MTWSLEGKTCLLTGATQGIGRAAARELARKGAKLTVVARHPDRTARTVEALREESGNPDVEALIADLSVMDEVRRVAREFRSRHERLDLLVNNAGGIFDQRVLNRDGIEHTFALDHLAYFVLTTELLPLLEASAPARVINVSSFAHYRGRIHWDDLMLERGYGQWKAYNQAKLANVLFTRELARRVEGKGVSAFCYHPGLVATGFGHNTQGWMKWLVTVGKPFELSPEKGADTLVWLASTPDLEGQSGRFFFRRRAIPPSPRARDDDAARRLWEVSEQLAQAKESSPRA